MFYYQEMTIELMMHINLCASLTNSVCVNPIYVQPIKCVYKQLLEAFLTPFSSLAVDLSFAPEFGSISTLLTT